jgi:hypothetical protein
MAQVVATFGRLISQRTKEALAVKKASGVRLGRPPSLPQPVVRRIQRLRSRGLSLRAIAENLKRRRSSGGPGWQAVVRGDGASRLAENVLSPSPVSDGVPGPVTVPLPREVAFGCGACLRARPG